ncbi:MAG: DEAD/DEAH box helicase family protein [Pseudomonadota bacterium]
MTPLRRLSPLDAPETEAETRTNRITPVLHAAGWASVDGARMREELLAPGRIQRGGRRINPKPADYVLILHGRPLAVVEAKKHGVGAGAGVAQAKDYADRLGTRFAYATDGAEWYAIDMDEGREGALDPGAFPTPAELWERTFGRARAGNETALQALSDAVSAGPDEAGPLAHAAPRALDDANAWRVRFGAVPYEAAGGKWSPRYYQRRAIDAALDAVAEGRRRVLLTLATGTGKTAIAFQTAWKLYQARWNLTGEGTRRPRILFLADRNILADQAVNAFGAFEADAIVRIDPKAIRKHGGVPKNGAVFFSIFQTLMTDKAGAARMSDEDAEDDAPLEHTAEPNYLDYRPDFFDCIIVDECHRGGANDESSWRGILEHFAPAVQIGLTATPKRKANVDTYRYFGEPAYEYALKTGIEDGYLTPFKVRQMASTMDEFTPLQGDVADGEIDYGRTYSEAELNRVIEVPERERARVREFLGQINQNEKTLVFCATQKHAALVRDLINQEAKSADPNYCVRVTAEDGDRGDQALRDFQDNERTIPTILTTSQKLSTGVDARNVRNIVLMRPVGSIVEFKQIVGRGTRTYPGKDHFTIIDFVNAYEHFRDPEWDGPPEEVTAPAPKPDDPEAPPPTLEPNEPDDESGNASPRKAVRVTLGGVRSREIQFISTTTYWLNGAQVSAEQFLRHLFGDLSEMVGDEDELRATWSDPNRRAVFVRRLAERGYDAERLDAMRDLINAPGSDIFDVLAYVRFELTPLTRIARADRVRETELADQVEEMKAFLAGVLANYERGGYEELDPSQLSTLLIARYGSIADAKRKLGPISAIKDAFTSVQPTIYRA